MSGSIKIVHLTDELKQTLKKFRFQKSDQTNAIILKIQREPQMVVIDETLENCNIEGVKEELSTEQPRFILLSYMLRHSDGRISNPLCLVFYSPAGCNPEIQMLYAGSMNNLVNECELTRSIEIRDLDELTEQFINEKLGLK